ncbi:alcohol-forming fatty acyl-CoA reductase-like [Durio zibethinus]|uniref:Fatty acyl-CoA reductase n=1 Tax=Durio zibethinus TaxID=66656 RepID=A0A6P5ZN60_DURZI|nr:alcohol-forming fatty acyl-CoA reductase-like [Durio zibethinus]
MEFGSVTKYLQDKTILVIGATGFLAKIFIEKILRTQPNVKKLYLLLRAGDTKSATQRLHNEIIRTELFSILRERYNSNFDDFISAKVTMVPGDTSSLDLGVKDFNLRKEMWREIDIVVNLAAVTIFDERYDVALSTNTLGALNAMNFAKKCDRIEMFLHTSTAYVCGEKEGIIVEKSYHMGEPPNGMYELNIDKEMKIVKEKLNQLRLQNATEEAITLAMKNFGIKRARLYGWPNTYVFTKAMGEMLLRHFKADLPLVLIRPTMVTSTYKEPFPGWIEGLRNVNPIILAQGKGKMSYFLGNPNTVLDLIPADMVINAMIVAMMAHTNQSCEIVYHIGSSLRNPLKFLNVNDYSFRYFVKNPLIDMKGNLIEVGETTLLSSMNEFLLHMAFHYVLSQKGRYLNYGEAFTDFAHKTNSLIRMAELYEHFAFFSGIFDDRNAENLQIAARECVVDVNAFNFDPKCIDWEDYVMNIIIPGLLRHVVKRSNTYVSML